VSVNWLNSRITNNNTTIQNLSGIAVACYGSFSTADGRYFSCYGRPRGARSQYIMLKCKQSTGVTPVGFTITSEMNAVSSDGSITYDNDTHVLRVDQGASAWAYPAIICKRGDWIPL
jgi:hypothetical protein